MFRSALFFGIAVTALGCAVITVKETEYLKEATGNATQDEVRQHLGAPRQVMDALDGTSTWVYEIRELEPGAQNSWASTGSWCDEYKLSFDQGGVLRQWTHNSYLHGGETQPVNCNSTLGVQKPAL
jgi:outer membrane protein assembly factor BamE (lipoprotein component of BamABCDE complex)